jgi:hypothetical protein
MIDLSKRAAGAHTTEAHTTEAHTGKTYDLVLVGCGAQKLATPAPAASLYTGPLFRMSADWARANGTRWGVLSAAHGLVSPADTLQPYELSLPQLGARKRRAWAHSVAAQVAEMSEGRNWWVAILAGAHYVHPLRGMLQAQGHSVAAPLGRWFIGQRLQWLKAQPGVRA